MTSAVAARRDRQVVRLLTLLKVLKKGGRPPINFKILFVLIVLAHDRRKVVHALAAPRSPWQKGFRERQDRPDIDSPGCLCYR